MSECHDYSPSNRTQGILNHSKQRIAVLAQIKKNCLDAINKMDTDQLFNVKYYLNILFKLDKFCIFAKYEFGFI